MNKILKWSLISVGIIILIIVMFAGWFFFRFKTISKEMKPMETCNVIENIYSVNDKFVNFFLIKDSSQYIAIDAGNDIENISAELKKLNILPESIAAVFLTHTDRDHVMGLKLFKKAKIYLGKEEVDMLNGKRKKFVFAKNSIYTNDYTLLEDNQTIKIGNIKVSTVLTPGHTTGSMCYVINDKYLFVGDAMGLKDGKIIKPIKFFNLDNDEAIASVKKITNIPGIECIFTAHFGYTNDYKNAVKDWKE